MIAHQTSNGCNLQVGDLIGSGTISGTACDSLGSLLEITLRGTAPLALPGGEQRQFLEDGDEIAITGRCKRAGFIAIGFGGCVGRIEPASIDQGFTSRARHV
jgi:fumarylacetoacetase